MLHQKIKSITKFGGASKFIKLCMGDLIVRVVMKWKFSLARRRVFSHEYSRVRAFFKMTIYNRNFSMFLIVIFRYFFEIYFEIKKLLYNFIYCFITKILKIHYILLITNQQPMLSIKQSRLQKCRFNTLKSLTFDIVLIKQTLLRLKL